MATTATIKKNIAKLEAALKSKATPKSLKPKLETQLVKSKAELSGMNKGTKPKTSSTKSTQTALQKLKEMVNKNKKYKTYKGAGVDLEKDADRPALRTGKRIAKESGKTYYEYRANRIDVKQPPKKYPKLAKGGEIKHDKLDEMVEKYQTWLDKNNLPQMSADELLVDESVNLTKVQRKYIQNFANEWDEEQDKYAKGGYMAKGGEVDKERMYNFLKDDLVALKKAIELNNQDEIDKFFSYWNIHLKSLEPKTGSKRMYEFLKDDLVGLEAATKELPSSKEETDRFFSYWNTHLKSLSDEDLINMMQYGGMMAKGGIVYLESVGTYLRTSDMSTSPMEDFKNEGEINSVNENSDEWWDSLSQKDKKTIEEYNTKHSKKSMAKGGYMAKGGFVIKYVDSSGNEKTRTDINGKPEIFKTESAAKFKISHVPALRDGIHKNIRIVPYMADGGISEKEVVESNAEMVLSQIKAVKHHAMELSNVVSKNSDIEAWVVAKIERASTDLSDITHYLEFQTKKMAMGGEIHRTQD